MNNDIERIREIREQVASENVEPITMGMLLAMEFPESRWVIEKLIPHQGITILSGPPGNFKTWLLLLMGISITRGVDFLSQFPASQSGVLIIDEEDHLRVLQERATLLGATPDIPIYFLSQRGFSVDNDTWVKKILDVCEKNKIDVIFIDSLVRIHSGNENEVSEMSKVFKQLKKFVQAGKTLVITHHERKEGAVKSTGQNRLRGSSDISAAVDSHISIRKDRDGKDTIIVEQPKLRSAEETPTFEVSVVKESGKISFMYVGNHSSKIEKEMRISEAIISMLSENEGRLPMKEIVSQIEVDEKVGAKIVRKVLKSLIESKEVVSENGKRNGKICSLRGMSDYQM